MGRTWIPSAYLDEISPPGRETPVHWIARHAFGDVFKLAPAFEFGDYPETDIRIGETVEFHCCDDHGEIEVTIWRDGRFECRGQVAPQADHFWIAGDVDSLATTLADFVKQYVESWPDDDEEQCTETVRMAWWSEVQPHMLVLKDGKPHFAVAGTARARQ